MTSPFSEVQALAYVTATAQALALPLDDARARQVAGHLGRTVLLARLLDSFPMAAHDELAEIYCPKPFPSSPVGLD